MSPVFFAAKNAPFSAICAFHSNAHHMSPPFLCTTHNGITRHTSVALEPCILYSYPAVGLKGCFTSVHLPPFRSIHPIPNLSSHTCTCHIPPLVFDAGDRPAIPPPSPPIATSPPETPPDVFRHSPSWPIAFLPFSAHTHTAFTLLSHFDAGEGRCSPAHDRAIHASPTHRPPSPSPPCLHCSTVSMPIHECTCGYLWLYVVISGFTWLHLALCGWHMLTWLRNVAIQNNLRRCARRQPFANHPGYLPKGAVHVRHHWHVQLRALCDA